jgi:hypothetical protein
VLMQRVERAIGKIRPEGGFVNRSFWGVVCALIVPSVILPSVVRAQDELNVSEQWGGTSGSVVNSPNSATPLSPIAEITQTPESTPVVDISHGTSKVSPDSQPVEPISTVTPTPTPEVTRSADPTPNTDQISTSHLPAPGSALPTEPFARQLPGKETLKFPGYVYESIPKIEESQDSFVAIPDRWRMFYAGKWYDPYNQNVLKADIPVFGSPGHEWFFEVSAISDSLFENRNLPVPVGFASTTEPNSNDAFGGGKQFMFVQNVVTSFSLIRGNTSFKPPELEIRVAPVFNFNHVEVQEDGALRADPETGNIRNDNKVSFQELFADIHLANISDRYDFISSRVGIQQFNADFRGFLYNDNQPGVRLFGNYNDNKTQFNLAWFSRLDKDTNSGVNTLFRDRYEDVYIANMFQQDLISLGHTVQFTVAHRSDLAGNYPDHYNENDVLIRPTAIGDQRPKNIHATYFGVGGDGHFGRINSTTQFYYVTGAETHNAIAQRRTTINAAMFAQEFSYDIDWVRLRGSFFWSSGDKDPFDSQANGFDTIFDNPNFAGGDLSFWQRQSIPLIGGGITNLVNRNSLVPNLRPGKEEGQSNYVNPGLRMYNVGIDIEVLPELKLINNASFLQFDEVNTLEVVRQDGSFGRNIGYDLSTGFLYRPFLNNNIQIRTGASCLLPTGATKNLFGNEVLYSLFGNLILQY